ncbi:MAG TPA: hypothetical protein VI299_12715 [Polyangiales bacterium]
MDSFWAVDSAFDILALATAMWATLCASVLYVDRAEAPNTALPVVSRPAAALPVASTEERFAA